MSAESRSEAAMRAVAAKRGQIIIEPKADELFVDIDGPKARDQFKAGLKIVRGFYPGAKIVRDTPSRTKGHAHIVVKLPGETLTHARRILLQALLGSDPKREILGLMRAESGEGIPGVFFEDKPVKNAGDAPEELEF